MRGILFIFFIFSFLLLPFNAWSGSATPTHPIVVTEQASYQLYYFFDLRERESFLQVMNTDTGLGTKTVHVQIFTVSNNCNENNFFDTYTPNDTHIYSFNAGVTIATNSGFPSGFTPLNNSFGFVVITVVDGVGGIFVEDEVLIGSFRIIDDNGFEYRTNAAGFPGSLGGTTAAYTFNFNNLAGTGFSDIVGITVDDIGPGSFGVTASDILNTFAKIDVDIYNNNEIPFSCRDVVFVCAEEGDPLFDDLLLITSVSAAGSEFGVNNNFPHSKGGELLCPGNLIQDGYVRLETENVTGEGQAEMFLGFAGLNDNSNRGSMEIITASP